MSRPLALHPVLFFLSTLLFFHAYNLGRLPLKEDGLPLLLLMLPVLAIELVVLRLKRARTAAVIFSLFLLLFFTYGQVYEVLALTRWTEDGMSHGVLTTIWIALFACGTAVTLRARSELANLTRILNVVSLMLVLMPFATIVTYPLRGGIVWGWSRAAEKPAPPAPNGRKPSKLPDIYYIILDRYAREDTLRSSYGYDNREFLDFLRAQGFYVASESRSNYMKTPLSLASSLNMEYIDYFTRDPGRDSSDWIPAYSQLRDYRVWRFLKPLGYKFVHMGSRWEPTRFNPHADVNINVFTPPEVVWALAEQSMLHPLGAYFHIGLFDFRVLEWERIPHQLSKLRELPNDRQPTFTFLHLLIPHGPYIFNPDGSYVSDDVMRDRTRRENYRNQLIYVNGKVRETIEKLLAASPEPPIIVIQSDEGPIPIRYPQEGLKFNWKEATDQDLREKTGILNAYYLPGVSQHQLYPSITPVNTFRLIFNRYFDTNFPILPDETYAHSHDLYPYDFFTITERLRAPEKRAGASGPQ